MSNLNPDPIRVLIVDQDARVRRGLRALIESTSEFAVVGEAACVTDIGALSGGQDPSVILLDLAIPEPRDGLELLAHLAGDQARVVVATSTRSGLRVAALQAGAQGFLDKGEAPDRILATLRTAVSGAQTPPESGRETPAEMK